jgi:signal transduction histidine kinase
VTKQKELDELKSQFVSNVSHELRTPLVAARNSLVVILGENAGNLTEDQKKYLSIAANNIKQLGRFIDDLLDVSKMEAKKMELHPTSVQIGTLINETCETLETWARTKNITIIKNVQDKIPDIKMDGGRIGQVLVNLIGNSIKFTPSGGSITVEAELKADGKNNLLVVRVIDTGSGIAKEDIPKLFSRFQQLKREDTNIKASGTGLGLSISKELIELHGGTIFVESEPDKGAIFAFTLPVV